MKITQKFAVTLLTATTGLMFPALSMAGDKHSDDKVKPLKGCYQVIKGRMEESAVDAERVIGTYKFVLAQEGRHKNKRVVISGPIAGSEGVGGHEEEGEEGGEESEGEIHGGHTLGTFNRSGTLTSNEDSFVATGASCYGDDGQPRLITGVETLKFHGGTGAFMGLNDGEIAFDVTFDLCTDPTNPIANLKVISGELCFQE